MPSLPQLAGWAVGLVVVFLMAGIYWLIRDLYVAWQRRRKKAVVRQLTGPEIDTLMANRPPYVDDMLRKQRGRHREYRDGRPEE